MDQSRPDPGLPSSFPADSASEGCEVQRLYIGAHINRFSPDPRSSDEALPAPRVGMLSHLTAAASESLMAGAFALSHCTSASIPVSARPALTRFAIF